MANQPVEQKLAPGTLKLEGTDRAVTAAQAKTLLPLWKAVKTLSSSNNASAEEITALYQQIQDAMTAEQLQAIKNLSLTQAEMQALMQQYGIQMPQMPAGNLNGTPAARSSGSSGNSSGAQAGDPGAGGFPPGGDFAGGPGGAPPDGGGFLGGGALPNAQTTPAAGIPQARPANRGFGGGMNNLFIDPLIKILEQRAGA
jgi:hypothetical protein